MNGIWLTSGTLGVCLVIFSRDQDNGLAAVAGDAASENLDRFRLGTEHHHGLVAVVPAYSHRVPVMVVPVVNYVAVDDTAAALALVTVDAAVLSQQAADLYDLFMAVDIAQRPVALVILELVSL